MGALWQTRMRKSQGGLLACFIIACAAVFILPVWGLLLFRSSQAWDLGEAQKSRGTVACFIAAGLYLCLGIFSFYRGNIANLCGDPLSNEFRFRVRRESYGTVKYRQVEMRPLLYDDLSDFSHPVPTSAVNPNELLGESSSISMAVTSPRNLLYCSNT